MNLTETDRKIAGLLGVTVRKLGEFLGAELWSATVTIRENERYGLGLGPSAHDAMSDLVEDLDR